jgi:hypothetical protein
VTRTCREPHARPDSSFQPGGNVGHLEACVTGAAIKAASRLAIRLSAWI